MMTSRAVQRLGGWLSFDDQARTLSAGAEMLSPVQVTEVPPRGPMPVGAAAGLDSIHCGVHRPLGIRVIQAQPQGGDRQRWPAIGYRWAGAWEEVDK
jgi:hypothetical protein